jgi:hypothetical protein
MDLCLRNIPKKVIRGKDALRKAKYITQLKPLYFYVVSIGRRFEFRVSYSGKRQLELVKDLIPFI